MTGVTGQFFLTIGLQCLKVEAMGGPQTAWHSSAESIGQSDNGPRQIPSLILGSQIPLLLMGMSLGWQLLEFSQMHCFM